MSSDSDQPGSKFAYSAASGLVLAAEIDATQPSSESQMQSLQKTVGLLNGYWETRERYQYAFLLFSHMPNCFW